MPGWPAAYVIPAGCGGQALNRRMPLT